MRVARYILVPAVKLANNVLLPIWDNSVKYYKSDDYGDMLKIEEKINNVIDLVECIYDLKTKTLSVGIEIDIYPKTENLAFYINEDVLYEQKSRTLVETKIVDIIYEEYDMSIYKGKKLENWYVNHMDDNDITIEKDSLYAIKHWKPTFVLGNGIKTKYEHQIFHKSK